MRRILRLVVVIVMLGAACGDDDGGGSTEAFCDLVEETAESEELPEPETMRALIDAAPSEIEDDVQLVGEAFIQMSEARDDPDAAADFGAAQTSEFQEAAEAIEDFSSEECGTESDPVESDGIDIDANGDGDAGGDDEEFDFEFVGVPGPTVVEAAGVELAGHNFVGGIVNEGVDRLQLYVDGLTEEQALDICQRVAERVANHPEGSGEGELAIGSGISTEGDTVLAETTVSPGDAGGCEIS